jgi:hypothetical protein
MFLYMYPQNRIKQYACFRAELRNSTSDLPMQLMLHNYIRPANYDHFFRLYGSQVLLLI